MNASCRLEQARQRCRLLDTLASHEPCSAHTLALVLPGVPDAEADIALGLDLRALRGLVVRGPGAMDHGPMYSLTSRNRRASAANWRCARTRAAPSPRRSHWLVLLPALLLAASCTHWPASDGPAPQVLARPALPPAYGVMQRERAGELLFEGCPPEGCPQPSLKTRPAAMAPAPVPANASVASGGAAQPISKVTAAPGVAVFFASGKARIDADSFALLDAVAKDVNGRTWRLKVTGRTDSRGRPALNVRLAEARARAIVRHLQRRGIDAQRIAIATDIREDASLDEDVRTTALPAGAQARARRAEVGVERTA